MSFDWERRWIKKQTDRSRLTTDDRNCGGRNRRLDGGEGERGSERERDAKNLESPIYQRKRRRTYCVRLARAHVTSPARKRPRPPPTRVPARERARSPRGRSGSHTRYDIDYCREPKTRARPPYRYGVCMRERSGGGGGGSDDPFKRRRQQRRVASSRPSSPPPGLVTIPFSLSCTPYPSLSPPHPLPHTPSLSLTNTPPRATLLRLYVGGRGVQ